MRFITILLAVILFAGSLLKADPINNPADINKDKKVDLQDFATLSSAWDSDDAPSVNWNSLCDISDPADGVIDALDISVLAANWLWYWSPSEPDPNQFAYIPSGEFEMGDHDNIDTDAPVHTVYLDSFYMSRYETTNQQYCDYLNSVMTEGKIKVDNGIIYASDDTSNIYLYCETATSSTESQITWDGSSFAVVSGKQEHPIVLVSWYGSAAYCNWMSLQDGYEACYDLSAWQCDFNKKGYRLPTEAQWEYASRGGEHDPYYRYPWGDNIDGSNANYWGSGDVYETGIYPWTTPVGYYDGNQIPTGTDMANGYGLYDMAGNVFEWCNDWYDSSYYGDSNSWVSNPTGPVDGTLCVMRGGYWFYLQSSCQVAFRYNRNPLGLHNGIGFRVCLDISDSN